MTTSLQPLTPTEALSFFRSKGLAASFNRFDWRDVWKEEHARAFTVAKAMQDDVLQTIRDELDKAMAEGRTLDQFRADLKPRLVKLGWWGTQIDRDPQTGELKEVKLGSAHRLRTIFDTNMRTSYAAGRWARIQRTKRAFPYLEYRQIQRPSKRDTHEPYHSIILPVDHPAWERIFPPNGFYCGCSVRQMSERMLKREGKSVTTDFELEEFDWHNERTGEIEKLPLGLSPGFDSNPGHAWLDIADRHASTLLDLPASHRAHDLAWTREIRARSLRDGDETLIVYDLDQAPEASPIGINRSTEEDPHSVNLTPEILRRAKDPETRAVAIHAHPSSGSFSLADIRLMLGMPGLEQIVAVGQMGSVFRMSRGSAYDTVSDNDLYAIHQNLYRAIGDAVAAQDLSPVEAAHLWPHLYATMLHEMNVINYAAAPHGAMADHLRRAGPHIEGILKRLIGS